MKPPEPSYSATSAFTTPGSPASWMPSPSVSNQTRLPTVGGRTVDDSEGVLFEVFGSIPAKETTAALRYDPGDCGLTVTMTLAPAPEATSPSWHCTTRPNGGAQVPWEGVVPMKTVPPGSVSVKPTGTPSGPEFVMLTV